MDINLAISLEPDLKKSLRKYVAIGKTGMLHGRECTMKRLNMEIYETIKCYCQWSDSDLMKTGEAADVIRQHILELCPNIK